MPTYKEPDNFRAMLLGTWIGIALIADALVRADIIDRDALVRPLAEAEALAGDGRHTPLATLRRLIAKGFAADNAANDP